MFFLKKIFFIFGFIFLSSSVFAGDSDCRNLLIRNLAEKITTGVDGEDAVEISSDGLIDLFSKNISVCREWLIKRTADEDIFLDNEELSMDLNWEYIRQEVAANLTTNSGNKQLFVCENDRSLQIGIEVGLWTATAVAAFFSAGTGGVAVQAGKTAVIEGSKAVVKIGVRKGATAAIKSTVSKAVVESTAKKLGTDLAAKKLASETAKKLSVEATKKVATNASIATAKANLRAGGTRTITNKALQAELNRMIAAGGANSAGARTGLTLLLNQSAQRSAAIAAGKAFVIESGAASKALSKALTTFAISTPIAGAGFMGSVYSYLESGIDTKVMNCTNTDTNNGCYLSCSKDSVGNPNDDLNTKVFKPIFGKNLCVDESSNYSLREIKGGGLPTVGDIFISKDDAKWEKARQKIESDVKDKGECDYNEDDVDMYVGAPLYNPDTLTQQEDGLALIITGIRLDD